ncbi:RNA polymerase sigma factor [Reichenbachiella versicolor]|uniref:RNA polymerase sigma factor n=1 Tax=Reichenbachiella versicolor TaxID=1821036 RepID=UPI001FECD241|nr:sigma-70 family RNA polymerase sigma factor [Reichenbachiella versicolor]
MENLSDQDLIEKYKASSSLEVLGVLYQRYMHLVYGVCLKYLKHREASRDAVSQIFEKLIVELLKHEVSNFKSWLHVLTRNYCLMQIRTQKHQRVEDSLVENMEYSLLPHHEYKDDSEVTYSKLDKCLEELNHEQKQCIKAFYLEEKSYAQVVAISGYEIKKVKSYIQNGKRNLKNCMEQNVN